MADGGGGQEFVATILDGKGKLGFKLAQQRVPGDFYAFVVEHVDVGGAADAAGILRGAQLLAVDNKLVVFAGNKATDFYEVLGVAPDATRGVIRKAYLQKALEQHPDRAAARGEDPGDGGAFVLISEAYATLADESHRASYDAMRGCRGCCVELGDVVKMIRNADGPVRLRFFEPPLCELSAARRGSFNKSPVRSAEPNGGGASFFSQGGATNGGPGHGAAQSVFQVAAAPSMSRLSWVGAVAQRASAGDVDALYKLGVDHALRIAEDWPAPDVDDALKRARKCLQVAKNHGDARANLSLRTLLGGDKAADGAIPNDGLRFAACASPLNAAATAEDAEAQLLVAIALIRINTANERSKALAHATAAAAAADKSLLKGKGTRDTDSAKRLLSAEAAYLAALVHLVDFDAERALPLLTQAADAGHPYAKHRLKVLEASPRPKRGCLCFKRTVDKAARRSLGAESFREWEQIRVYTATAAPSPPQPPPPTAEAMPRQVWRPPPPQPMPEPIATPGGAASPSQVLASFLFCDAGAAKYSQAINGLVCSSKRDGGLFNMVCFEQGAKKTQIVASEDVLEDIEFAWSQNAGHAEDDFDDMGAQVALHVADEDESQALIPADFDFNNADNPLQLTPRSMDL